MSEENEQIEENEQTEQVEQQAADEWVPPTKAEIAKRDRDERRLRKDLENMKSKLAQQTDLDDVDAIKAQVREEEASKYRLEQLRTRAEIKLAKLGAQGDLTRLVRMFDLDADTSDGDLDEQIDQAREDYPSLFSTRRKADPRLRGDAPERERVQRPLSSAEKIYKQMHN